MSQEQECLLKEFEKQVLDISKENDLYNGLGHLTETADRLFVFDGGGKATWLDLSTRDIPSRKETKIGKIDLNFGCWCNTRGLVPGGKFFILEILDSTFLIGRL